MTQDNTTDTTVTTTTPAATTTVTPPATSAAAALTDTTTPAAAAPAGLVPPGADAKPEDWQAFYRKLGAPEKGDDYKLEVPEGGDPEFAKEAANWFAEIGLRPDQAQKLAAKWNEKAGSLTKTQSESAAKAESDRITALDIKNKAEEAQLMNNWGQSHAMNMALAKQAKATFLAPHFGDKTDAVLDALEGLVGYKATISFMHAIGKGLGEGAELGLGSNPAAQTGGSALEASYRADLARAGINSRPA